VTDGVQVQALFADCGEINAITIPVDKFTGRAKGFAYLEFAAKVCPGHVRGGPLAPLRVKWSCAKCLAARVDVRAGEWCAASYAASDAGVCIDGDGEEQRAAARPTHQGD